VLEYLHEAARIHHSSRRHGARLAARCAGAAAGRSAADRRAHGVAESHPYGQAFVAAFREGLQKLGWAEGRNIRIDTRWATDVDAEARQRFAKELIALQPDLILSHATPTTATLLQQTRTIPIIFVNVSDPVGSGLVASFPRPGGSQMCHTRKKRAYSITSSARPSSVSGKVRPSAFAVLRLMTSSIFVSCCTDMSAGFSPLRMRPV
jgi:hypothetical protein